MALEVNVNLARGVPGGFHVQAAVDFSESLVVLAAKGFRVRVKAFFRHVMTMLMMMMMVIGIVVIVIVIDIAEIRLMMSVCSCGGC